MILTATPAKSNPLLYLALAVTLSITIWTAIHSKEDSSPEGIVLTKRASYPTRQAINSELPSKFVNPTIGELSANQFKREPMKQPVLDLFKVHSWYVPPPVKKVAPAPPPVPVAPPVPFIYNGKLESTEKGTLIFLVANNVLYTVKKGDNVTPQWRLDAENGGILRFTYIPLNLPQTLLKSTVQTSSVATAEEVPAQNN